MVSLSVENISLAFGVNTVLDGISFGINDGDKLGIVGMNGAGKTTLFKIITGEYTADSGSVYISKDKKIGVLNQNMGFDSEKTVLEETLLSFPELLAEEEKVNSLRQKAEGGNISAAGDYAVLHDKFTADGGYVFRERCKSMLKNLGFGEDYHNIKITSLSGGQKMRIALGRLLLGEPDLLMLDEPTNYLDIKALTWLEKFLGEYRKTVIVISHDRYFLDRVVNKVLEIENKKACLYGGNYSSYVAQKAENREIQEKHYKNQQKEIARIEAYIEQQRRWNRERNIIAAESRQKQPDKLERVERPAELPDKIKLRFNKTSESGNEVVRVRALKKGYPQKQLFSGVDFLIKKQERVFICGENGCGKSTLVKILAGKEKPDSGDVVYGYNVKIGYYDQEIKGLTEEKTVVDELWDCYPKLTETEIRCALARFLFKGDDIKKTVSVLSGGERARLTLLKLIMSDINLLILDEPQNHLDINSGEVLEDALAEFEGTMICVSHDRYFIDKLATRILDFGYEKGGVFSYYGSYSEYCSFLEKKGGGESAVSAEAVSEGKEKFLQKKRETAELKKAERTYERAKKEAEETENLITSIDEEMNGDAASDHVRLSGLYEKKSALESRLLELYEIIENYENQ